MRVRKQDAQPLRGFRELPPEDFAAKLRVIETSRALFKLYGYEEMEIPTVEPAALIELKSGEEIRHRMFRFRDLGGRDVVLRPEGTPSVARYVAFKLKGKRMPVRLSYVANMFRYDEPQRGRFREFTHVGCELFGSSSLLADVEVLDITLTLLSELGFSDFTVKIGHQGVIRAVLDKFGITGVRQDAVLGMIDRGERQKLAKSLGRRGSELNLLMKDLAETKGRDTELIFSRARDLVSDIPQALKRLEELRELVDFANEVANGRIMIDLGFARGIEYYTGMIFEVSVKGLNLAVAGGGRYDGLCSLLGAEVPAVGMALGVDRLVMGEEFGRVDKVSPYATVVILDPGSHRYGLRVLKELRGGGTPVTLDLSTGSLSSRMERVAVRGFKFAVIVGQSEAAEGKVTVKDMEKGAQQTTTLGEAKALMQNSLRRTGLAWPAGDPTSGNGADGERGWEGRRA